MQESEFLSMGHRDTLAAAGRLHSFDSRVRNSIDSRMHSFDGRVQNSLDGRMQNSLDGRMHNSFDLDWAGRPGNDALSVSLIRLIVCARLLSDKACIPEDA